MRHAASKVFKVMVVTGALVALAALVLPSNQAGSPYLSALSSLASAPEAAASSTCTNRVCDSTGTRCVNLHNSNSNCARGDFCRQSACL